MAAERTLARVLSLDKGIEPALAWVPSGGPLARTIMQARRPRAACILLLPPPLLLLLLACGVAAVLRHSGAVCVLQGSVAAVGPTGPPLAHPLGPPRPPPPYRPPLLPSLQEAFLRRLSKMPAEEEDDGLL